MRWIARHLGRWAAGVFLLVVLAGCLGDTRAPDEADAQYAIGLESGTLTMRDGVRLAVTYYRPVAKTPGETFPVILEMLPYRKDDFFALGDYEYGAYFARRGYVVARVDVRGTGGSEGPVPVSEYSEAEIADAVEVIAQLAAQQGSNGKVGMYGLSWSAFNSLMTAQRKPPALKAIIAAHGSTDLYYNDVHYIDGALHIDSYAHQIDTDNSMPQSPAYQIDATYFRDRFDQEPWLFTWLRQQQDGDFWRKESIGFQAPLEVPVYLIGGLLDGYRDFVLEVSRTAKAPVIAEIGPWNHAWPEYGQPGPNYEWRQRALRWWDYWLKDIDTGVLQEPNWMVFMRTGHPPSTHLTEVPGYWRCDNQGPSAAQMGPRWYPQVNQQLAAELSGAPATHSLRYRAGAGLAAGGWWGELTGDMAADDAHSLVYDSAPLTEAVEILGRPEVQLRVAADAPLYHWSVRLEDVAPDGAVTLVSGAVINPSQRVSRLDPVALTPGEFTTLRAAIHTTTWRFRPGHRIRLAIANAQFPMIWPTPTAGATQLQLGQDTWMTLPVVAPQEAGSPTCRLPAPELSEQASFGREVDRVGPTFTSERDEATGSSAFSTASELIWMLHDNRYQSRESYRWEVTDAAPEAARYQGERQNVFTIDGRVIDLSTMARIESDATDFHVTFTKVLRENGRLVRERTWTESIPRRYQ